MCHAIGGGRLRDGCVHRWTHARWVRCVRWDTPDTRAFGTPIPGLGTSGDVGCGCRPAAATGGMPYPGRSIPSRRMILSRLA